MPNVLITGCSSGIGRALADAFKAAGYTVWASARRPEDVAALAAAGFNAVELDVNDSAALRRLAEQLGELDVLINNAGILKTLPLAQHSDELYDQNFDIHTRGTFNALREAATRLNDGGRIVNFSSSTVGLNFQGYAVYIASKAAVESLTQVFAKEMRGRRITVNAVAPGPVATELFLHGKSEEQIQGMAKMPPLERLGQPEDIARVVAFLVSPAGGWVNGQILRANGGLV